jgi:uncharacterized sulfatase
MDRRDLEHVLALYDGEIRLVDDHIGKLAAVLERLGIAGRTVLVVTADHGDEFFEHGRKGHHRTLYEEVIHVPLMIRVPGVAPAVKRSARDVSIIDIMPTVLGLTGVDIPDGVEGTNLTPIFTGRGELAAEPVFAELYRKGSLIVEVAVIEGHDKIIHAFNDRRMETFELRSDPGELQLRPNMTGPGATMAAKMKDWLTDRWKPYDRRLRVRGIESLELDDDNEEALRALGYIE